MASTILEQILENVQRGVALPQGEEEASASSARPKAAPGVEYLEETLLSELSLELQQLETELRRHPGILRTNLNDPAVRETITQVLAEIVDEEIADGYLRAVASRPQAEPPSPPESPWIEP